MNALEKQNPQAPASVPAHENLSENSELAVLIFDSATSASPRGVRGVDGPARQLLYRMGTVCIDLCVQPELGSKEFVLVGQLSDSQESGHGLGDIPVSLLCEGNQISQDKTNAVGEFVFGFRTLHGGELVFAMGRKTLVVPVPDTDA